MIARYRRELSVAVAYAALPASFGVRRSPVSFVPIRYVPSW